VPSERKIQTVKNLKEKLAKARGVVLTDYQGLSVPEVEALRVSLREVSADLQVVKNTLLNLALKENAKVRKRRFFESSKMQNAKLTGPTAVALSYEDEIALLKVLSDFAKEHPQLKIKGGFFEGVWLLGEKLKEIASLPSREVLLAKITGLAQSPIWKFVSVSKANICSLVGVLANISESKANRS